MEETEPDIFRIDFFQEPGNRWLILRTHRPHRHVRAIPQLQFAFPLGRIRPDCKSRPSGEKPRRGTDHDASIQRQHASLVCEQRIDIQFGYLRQIGYHLRELHQSERHDIVRYGGNVAIGRQQPADSRPPDEIARQVHVERRQCHRLVPDYVDRRASSAEYDDRAESGVISHPHDQFPRMWTDDHWLNDHTLDFRFRSRLPRPRHHGIRCLADIRLCGQIENDAAKIRFVADVAGEDLDGDAHSLRQKG